MITVNGWKLLNIITKGNFDVAAVLDLSLCTIVKEELC